MKKVGTFIGALAVALAGAYYAYYLSRTAPDVRYTLSDKIPVSFLGPNEKLPENVQQVEVKNVGNAVAKKIQIKINGDVTSWTVEKFSEADPVETYNQNRVFELIYPELPAQAGFKVIFKSVGDGVKYYDLNVNDNGGKARDALSNDQSSINSYLSLGLIVLYFVLIVLGLRQMAISFLESTVNYENVDRLLQRKKPWYISDSKWRKILENGLNYRLAQDYVYGGGIRKSEAYKLLDSDKPQDFDDVSWRTIIDKAIDSLDKHYSKAADALYADAVLELLHEKKPKQFPEKKWDELSSKASEKYVSLRRRSLHSAENVLRELREQKPQVIKDRYWSDHIESLQKEYLKLRRENDPWRDSAPTLREKKPEEIPEHLWVERIDSLKKQYLEQISARLENQEKPVEYAKEQDLTLFAIEDREWFNNKAYRAELKRLPDLTVAENAKTFLESARPEWLYDQDYSRLKATAERALSLDEKEGTLQKLDEELKNKKKEITEESERLASEKKAFTPIKEKVERQLNIIHSTLNDPSTIERIEDYSNVFAPGNFESLKKIAEYLRGAINS